MHPALIFAVGVFGTSIVGVLDFLTGSEIRLFPLYLLPVAFVAWRGTRASAVFISLLSAVVWAMSNQAASLTYSSILIWPINVLAQFVAFSIVGVLVAELRHRLQVEEALSRRDSLTNLLNGRAFYEQGELLVALARRADRPITLAYLDLDNFKKVNDQWGHQEGDHALVMIADILREQLRSSDLPARLGGDEFAIILPDTGPGQATTSLERLRRLVAERMQAKGWPITASIGAVAYLRAPRNVGDAVQRADTVMYQVKNDGKDRVRVESAEPL